jgi:hypothetical protein
MLSLEKISTLKKLDYEIVKRSFGNFDFKVEIAGLINYGPELKGNVVAKEFPYLIQNSTGEIDLVNVKVSVWKL